MGKGFIVYLLLQVSVASASLYNPSVISGEKVLPEEAIAGSVVYVRMGAGACTGTLINSKTVVTASHCPDMGGASGIVVRHQGAVEKCKAASVVEFARPANAYFDSVAGHHTPDIVLMKLDSPMCNVQPASLHYGSLGTGSVVTAAGYGKGTSAGVLPDRLQIQVENPDDIVSTLYAELDPNVPDEADLLEATKQVVTESSPTYTIGTPVRAGRSLCNGDSGGPTYVENGGRAELVGINGAIFPHPTKGASACKFAFLQFFTPIAPYMNWIETTAANWEVY